jgi:hypothetical protein
LRARGDTTTALRRLAFSVSSLVIGLFVTDGSVLVWQSGTSRYYSSGDRSGLGLEYKKHSYAFDVSQSHIEIVGFHRFGSAVRRTGELRLRSVKKTS